MENPYAPNTPQSLLKLYFPNPTAGQELFPHARFKFGPRGVVGHLCGGEFYWRSSGVGISKFGKSSL